MLKAADVLRALAYPATNVAVLLSATMLFLLMRFAAWGGILGLFLIALLLPALLRYQMRILDARAKGEDPGPLQAEDLMWLHHPWSLFQVVHLGIIIAVIYYAVSTFGYGAILPTAAVLAAVLPASLAVLAITRAPLESLNPIAIGRLIDRAGGSYWVLPSYLVAATALLTWLDSRPIPTLVADGAGFYLNLVFYALIGTVLRPFELHEEVDIHEPVEPERAVVHAKLEAERTNVLNHAYGFISRDNRAGGLRHIESWLRQDPDPESAWQWFFDQMMRWEIREPALVFAQSYVHELLAAGEQRTASKVMLRCLHANDNFKPLPDDMSAAIEAAEAAGNQELAARLRARV